MEFEEMWTQIRRHQGQTFHTIRGKELRYTVEGDLVYHNLTPYPLSRSDFEKAFRLMPLTGPGQIQYLVRGPSYIYAILTALFEN